MCGIAGFIDYKKETVKETLTLMTDVLAHRGPDDMGYEVYTCEKASVGLGHRRLSILDLSSLGHQPMEYGDWSIVFNGEIYNFGEIKIELQEKYSIDFKSHADTEVIIHAFDRWGIACVDKFNGMFAFAIFNKKTNEVYCVRDRAGVKPLYYYQSGELFLFSSELKSFHQHPKFEKSINPDVLGLYFQYGYIPSPYSIFEKVKKVSPGSYLYINLNNNTLEEKKYWDIVEVYNQPKLSINIEDAILETENLLKSAFKYRLISDVPVGIFLSGGYDSAAVAALLQSEHPEKLKTFTIGFEDNAYDEAPFAKKVADYLGTEHHEYYCTEKDALEIIPTLSEIYDEPFADSSAIPTILVSKIAAKDVTVVLSADGGDEAFGGYTRYTSYVSNYYKLCKIPKPFRKLISAGSFLNLGKSLKNLGVINSKYNYNQLIEILSGELNVAQVNKISTQKIPSKDLKRIIKQGISIPTTFFDEHGRFNQDNDALSKVMAIDYGTYMVDDILTKVDRATMSVSIEAREPLIDHRIIEFVSKLPTSYKINGATQKYILKEIVHKYVPKEMMERPKKGFGIPLAKWLHNDLKSLVLTYLNEDRIKSQGIFNHNELTKVVKEFYNGENEAREFLWNMLMFQMWYSKWM